MSEENTKSIDRWHEFKKAIDRYINLPGKRRDQLIFRGQGNSSWGLLSSLDRQLQNDHALRDRNREEVRISLLDAFKREILGLNVNTDISEPIEWECYARHNGLPTRILDWTSSPYIAAFFAFAGDPKLMGDSVAVWVLDRAAFEESRVPVTPTGSRSTLLTEYIEIFDDLDLLRINPRAIEQKALFMIVKDAKIAIERRLFKYLSRILNFCKFTSTTISPPQRLQNRMNESSSTSGMGVSPVRVPSSYYPIIQAYSRLFGISSRPSARCLDASVP